MSSNIGQQPNIIIKRIDNDGTESTFSVEYTKIENIIRKLMQEEFKQQVHEYLSDIISAHNKMVPGSMGYQNSNQLSGITYENQLLPLQNLMGSHIDVNNIQEYRVYNKLEEIFEKRGIIQQKVADMVGISSKTLSNIVSNRYNTSLDVAFRICAVIGVASDSVFYLAKSDNKGNIEK